MTSLNLKQPMEMAMVPHLLLLVVVTHLLLLLLVLMANNFYSKFLLAMEPTFSLHTKSLLEQHYSRLHLPLCPTWRV